jgi:protein-tyrosine sulfotransferase
MKSIFIGGSQRSGTTMLQLLLCQCEQVNPMIHEAQILYAYVQAYRIGKSRFNIDGKDYFRDENAYLEFNRRWFEDFIESISGMYSGLQYLVLKNPRLTRNFVELAELNDDMLFIVIVRDPRDVIASMIQVGHRLYKYDQSDTQAQLYMSRNISEMSKFFLSFYLPLFTEQASEMRSRLRIIRYENLVQNTSSVLLELGEFCGLNLSDIESAQVMDTGNFSLDKRTEYSKAWNSGYYGKAVDSSRIGRYKQELTQNEIAEVEKKCADFMLQFGYFEHT